MFYIVSTDGKVHDYSPVRKMLERKLAYFYNCKIVESKKKFKSFQTFKI